jgi:hypothetical protein
MHGPSPFQHGFRRNHSTTTATLTIQNYIARGLDKKRKGVVISTDMSAAFDLLDKEILLPRMAKLEIPQNIIRIYNDFHSNQKAFVQCNQSKSGDFNIPIGCVQGSPSDPYLFTLLVDGISEYLPYFNLGAYTDDMYFKFEANTWKEVVAIAAQKQKQQSIG